MSLRVGIDIGSTTVKVVVLDEQNKLLFRSYERHFSKTRERALDRTSKPPSPAPPDWGWPTPRASTLSRRSTPPPPP